MPSLAAFNFVNSFSMSAGFISDIQGVSFIINGKTEQIPWGPDCVRLFANCRQFTESTWIGTFTFSGPEFDDASVALFLKLATSSDPDFTQILKTSDEAGRRQRQCLLSMANQLQFTELIEFLENSDLDSEETILRMKLEAAMKDPESAAAVFHDIAGHGDIPKMLRRQNATSCAKIFEIAKEKNAKFGEEWIQRTLMDALIHRIAKKPEYLSCIRFVDMKKVSSEQIDRFFELEGIFGDGTGGNSEGQGILEYIHELGDTVRSTQDTMLQKVANCAEAVAQTELEGMDRILSKKMRDYTTEYETKKAELEDRSHQLLDTESTITDTATELQSLCERANAFITKEKCVDESAAEALISRSLLDDLRTEFRLTLNGDERFPQGLKESQENLTKLLTGQLDRGEIWVSPMTRFDSNIVPYFLIDFSPQCVVIRSYKLSCPKEQPALRNWVLLGLPPNADEWVEIDRHDDTTRLNNGEEVEFQCAKVTLLQQVKFALARPSNIGPSQIILRSFHLFGGVPKNTVA